jgi:dinuclear metal center YbgI/SA1388 family protein
VASLSDIVQTCQDRLGLPGFPDYPGAMNGLQVSNNGTVSRIGAAVDAGLEPFRRAAAKGVDFLIVHHGLFWEPPRPFVDVSYDKLAVLIRSNLAVFSAHLPLDAHPEIGNNAMLARRLRLEPVQSFLPFEGRDIGLITRGGLARADLRRRLESLFAHVTAIEFGGAWPERIAIVTGGGASAVGSLRAAGVDTLITGELKEHIYNVAQEEKLNLFACGHYATEVFGVCALAEELARKFDLPWEFIPTENPL